MFGAQGRNAFWSRTRGVFLSSGLYIQAGNPNWDSKLMPIAQFPLATTSSELSISLSVAAALFGSFDSYAGNLVQRRR